MSRFETTFNDACADYEASRPIYPKKLYKDLFVYQPIDVASKVLEIGMGTGKATLPVLLTGCNLVGLEPGEELVKVTKEKFQGYTNFSLKVQTLQDFICPSNSFDLIYSATAFHWIPEGYGYPRVYELLKSGGTFARFRYHAEPDFKRQELTNEIKQLYQKYMDLPKELKLFSDGDAKNMAQIAAKYGFIDTDYRIYHMTKEYTADDYMKLLRTYPDHMSLESTKRKALLDGIHDAIMRHGGVMTVYYTIDLELARKK